jgi:hypothetical protein
MRASGETEAPSARSTSRKSRPPRHPLPGRLSSLLSRLAVCWPSGDRLAPPGRGLVLRRHCDGAPPGDRTTKAIAGRRQPTTRDGRWESRASAPPALAFTRLQRRGVAFADCCLTQRGRWVVRLRSLARAQEQDRVLAPAAPAGSPGRATGSVDGRPGDSRPSLHQLPQRRVDAAVRRPQQERWSSSRAEGCLRSIETLALTGGAACWRSASRRRSKRPTH